MHTPHSALCTLHGEPYTLHQQEEAQAVKMFEALLDSAAAEGAPSSPAVSSETLTETSVTSRTTAATGKAYRALKELVRATQLLPLSAALATAP